MANGGEKPHEHADGRQPTGHRARALAFAGLVLEIDAEGIAVGGEESLALCGKVILHVFKVAAIGVQRIVSQSALGGQMEQERPKGREGDACFGGRAAKCAPSWERAVDMGRTSDTPCPDQAIHRFRAPFAFSQRRCRPHCETASGLTPGALRAASIGRAIRHAAAICRPPWVIWTIGAHRPIMRFPRPEHRTLHPADASLHQEFEIDRTRRVLAEAVVVGVVELFEAEIRRTARVGTIQERTMALV